MQSCIIVHILNVLMHVRRICTYIRMYVPHNNNGHNSTSKAKQSNLINIVSRCRCFVLLIMIVIIIIAIRPHHINTLQNRSQIEMCLLLLAFVVFGLKLVKTKTKQRNEHILVPLLLVLFYFNSLGLSFFLPLFSFYFFSLFVFFLHCSLRILNEFVLFLLLLLLS